MEQITINFTKDQEEALDSMIKWVNKSIKKDEDLFYLLSGSAGTGKSFLLKYFIEQSNLRNLVVTAPTHKAKKVIADMTKLPAETIQSLLGLRPDVNMEFFDINRPTFNPLAEETINEYKYVFIDEASMLNTSAFDLIVSKAIEYDVRVIFIGDELQLPPINEIISKSFTHIKNASRLTTIVRQESTNPNLKILNLIRSDIQYNKSMALEYIYKNPSNINELGEGYLALNPTNFIQALTNKFCETLALNDINYIRYLAYTNKSVADGCRGIRNKRIGTEASNLLVKDDFLLGYNSIRNTEGSYNILENSEDYTVKEIRDSESKFGILCYWVTLVDSGGNETGVRVVKRESYQDFLKIFRSKLKIAKQRRGKYWEYYYDFKKQHLIMEDFYYQGGGLELKKDLYYGYGLTTHKSQGSTYKNVAINVRDIMRVRKIQERNKLLYVALSRTSNLNILNI